MSPIGSRGPRTWKRVGLRHAQAHNQSASCSIITPWSIPVLVDPFVASCAPTAEHRAPLSDQPRPSRKRRSPETSIAALKEGQIGLVRRQARTGEISGLRLAGRLSVGSKAGSIVLRT